MGKKKASVTVTIKVGTFEGCTGTIEQEFRSKVVYVKLHPLQDPSLQEELKKATTTGVLTYHETEIERGEK